MFLQWIVALALRISMTLDLIDRMRQWEKVQRLKKGNISRFRKMTEGAVRRNEGKEKTFVMLK